MDKKSLLIVLIILGIAVSVYGYSDFYNDILATFSIFEDPNTGLTIFPTLLIPLGGKYEGMGTAYTAMANDSGFIESNPAGSSMLFANELSFHHHSWISDSNIEGVVYSARIDDFGFAAAGKFLYLPFTSYNDWGQRESEGLISETIAIVNASYNFFSNYYFSGIALGINLKGAYRGVPETIYPGQSIVAGMLDIGLLTRLNLLKFYSSRTKNFSIGLAVKNVGIQSVEEPLPMVFSSGIAYSFIKPVTVAVDFNLPFSFYPENYPAELWDISTGVDVVITDFISMQAGFRFKENPRVSLGCSVDLKDFSLVTNYNVDLSGSFNPVDKFSVEVKIKFGYSENLKRQKEVDTLFAKGLEAYAQGDYLLAIEYWEKALELDPKFLLAAEYIKTTKEYLKLQEEMKEKQENIE